MGEKEGLCCRIPGGLRPAQPCPVRGLRRKAVLKMREFQKTPGSLLKRADKLSFGETQGRLNVTGSTLIGIFVATDHPRLSSIASPPRALDSLETYKSVLVAP